MASPVTALALEVMDAVAEACMGIAYVGGAKVDIEIELAVCAPEVDDVAILEGECAYYGGFDVYEAATMEVDVDVTLAVDDVHISEE